MSRLVCGRTVTLHWLALVAVLIATPLGSQTVSLGGPEFRGRLVGAYV